MLARHRLGGLSRQGSAALVTRYMSRIFGAQLGAGRPITTANCTYVIANETNRGWVIGNRCFGDASPSPQSSPLRGEGPGRAVVSDVLKLHPLSRPWHWLSGVVNTFSTTRTLKQSVQLFQYPSHSQRVPVRSLVMVGCYRTFRRGSVACRSRNARRRLCCRPHQRLFPETCQRLDW